MHDWQEKKKLSENCLGLFKEFTIKTEKMLFIFALALVLIFYP
jgi:hypothetical protein